MSASNDHIRVVHPPHFPSPKGYADGIVCTGRTLYVAGQIGWKPDLSFPHKDMAGQFGQALQNVIDVVTEAGGSPEHIVKMTVYATDVDAYRQSLREIGALWRTHMGTHFPAMALVGVTELVEREALVEIEAIASLPEEEGSP